MNKFRIVIELDTYSEAPEEWVVDAIGENLEEDESLVSCNIERVSTFSTEYPVHTEYTDTPMAEEVYGG